jgi:hypothetical protein
MSDTLVQGGRGGGGGRDTDSDLRQIISQPGLGENNIKKHTIKLCNHFLGAIAALYIAMSVGL